MRILESFENLNKGYLSYYNVNLAFVIIPSDVLNPIAKDYRNGATSLKEACQLLKTYLS